MLLKSKPSQTFTEIQRFYLLLLSSIDCVYATVYLAKEVLSLVQYPGRENHFDMLHYATGVLFYILYIGLMTLLTLDRFISVYLHLRYHLYWTLHRARIAFGFLVLLACVTIPMFMFESIRPSRWAPVLILWPSMEFVFLFVASVTYIYLFKKLRKFRQIYSENHTPNNDICYRQQQQNQGEAASTNAQDSSRGRTNNSKGFLTRGFFTPTLLVANFIVIFIISDQVYFWLFILDIDPAQTVYGRFLSHNIIYNFGFLCDAFIYSLSKKEVRIVMKRLFKTKLCKIW